jgi:hypothetical protein
MGGCTYERLVEKSTGGPCPRDKYDFESRLELLYKQLKKDIIVLP